VSGVAAIVFDLFDTLVDLHMERIPPERYAGRLVAGTARRLHAALSGELEVSFDRFVSVLGETDGEFRESRYAKGLELPTEERFAAFLERLGVKRPELVELLTEVHMGALREQVEILDHHVDVMRRLRAQVSLALCSNFSHSKTALRVLETAGLTEYLEAIVISDAAGIRKPRPEIFLQVLDALGVSAAEALHVGDNLSADVSGASRVGIRTVWITRRIADPDARLQAHDGPTPDYTIRDLSQLLPLVESLGPARGR
jgi:HAD superfamily hydrolase (TIGR01549 family)